MGSSKSGSLDGLAKFSLPAAIGAGKIKLPETGIVGMLQARQEDKMNKGAQMAQQDDNQMTQYMKMMQQQMNPGMNMGGRVGLSEGGEPSMERVLELEEQGFSYEEAYEKAMQELLDYKGGYAAGGPVESMNFLKQHLPYQDGGHVALRRKMFKLGGPVNTHGIGITSGLEYRNNYNAGGAVAVGSGNNPKVMGPDGQMREGHSLGSFIANAALFGLPKLVKFANRGKGTLRYGEKGFDEIIKKRKAVQKQIDELSKMKSSTTKDDLIKEFYRAGKLSDDAIAKSLGITRAGKGVAGTALKTGRALYPLLGPGVAGAGITSALMNEEPTTRGGQLAKGLTEGYLDFSGPGAIAAGVDYLNTPLDEEYKLRGLSDMLGGNKAKDKPTNDFKNENLGAPPTSYGDAVDDLQKQQMEEQIARYVELLQGNDDQNKLAMLGDSLIGAGSALMAGEGYGAAGQAFNDPLSEKLRARDERKQAVRQGAAELAIGQDISRRTADEAMTRELLATGQIGTAEEIKKYNYAMALGADSLVPQNEKEELDLEALKEQGYRSRVLADPRNLVGQDALFLAINKSGVALPFNDIEAARQHAASE